MGEGGTIEIDICLVIDRCLFFVYAANAQTAPAQRLNGGGYVPGPNRLTNAGFNNGLAGWTVSVTGNGIVEVIDGDLHIFQDDSENAYAAQSVLGDAGTYDLEIGVSQVTGFGVFGVAAVGPFLSFTTPGVKRFTVTNPGNPLFIINRNSLGSNFYISYASVRRREDSMSKVILELRDYDGDKKQTSIDLGPVTDGTSYTARAAEAAAIRDAVNAVAGNVSRYAFNALDSEPNNVNAATPVFQTHVRWIVEMVDSVSGDGPYAFDIPTADLGNSDLFLPGSVEHDPAAAEWIALKAAMNGIAINYRTGSPMNITRIYLEE